MRKRLIFAETGAQAFRWKGVLLLVQENYYEALNNYFAALKYYEFNTSFATLYIYQDIAIIYQRLENTDQAILLFYTIDLLINNRLVRRGG